MRSGYISPLEYNSKRRDAAAFIGHSIARCLLEQAPLQCNIRTMKSVIAGNATSRITRMISEATKYITAR